MNQPLKEEIVNLLRDPRLLRINFSCVNCRVRGTNYQLIAELIQDGKLRVIYDPSISVAGRYYRADNYFVFSFATLSNIYDKGNVIHECTHAIQDLNQKNLSLGVTEVTAYIAQLMYYKLNDRLPRFPENNVTIWNASVNIYNIANRLLTTNMTRVRVREYAQAKLSLGKMANTEGVRPYRKTNKRIRFDGF